MNRITEAYVLDETGTFRNETYTAKKLAEMDNCCHPDMIYIRSYLYSKKEKSEDYRVVFVNRGSKPYFRHRSVIDAKKWGFSSVNESFVHKVCKNGLSRANQVKIKYKTKNSKNKANEVIINSCGANVEVVCELMGRMFETDCLLNYPGKNGDIKQISFEIHHKSKTKAEKIDCYRLNGKPVMEFDVPLKVSA